MSPILTVILAQLFSRRGEKLGKWVYIGAVVAIAGVVMVVFNGQLSFHLSPLGDLLALAAALMWAVYSILVKKYTERYDNFLVTRRVFLWAFLTSLPLVLLTDGLPSLTPLFTQPNILVSWLFLGVFGNAVCFAIWNIAFKRLGVVITNNYLYATPFVTVVAGWLLLGRENFPHVHHWCRPDHAGCHLRREVGFLSIFAVHFFLHRGTPVRASLFSSPPHPSRFLNGGCCSDLYKIANGYATPSVHSTAFRREMQSPPLDRKENFGYNRRYNRCGGIYAVRR